MTYSNKAIVQQWKSVELEFRQSFHTQGFSKADTNRLANALTLWCLVTLDLVDDVRVFSPRQAVRWGHSVAKLPPADVANTSKDILILLRNFNTCMGSCDTYSFKQSILQVSQYAPLIMQPMRAVLNDFLASGKGFRTLNTFLSFISRLTLKDVEAQEDEALLKLIHFDESWNADPSQRGIGEDGERYLTMMKEVLKPLSGVEFNKYPFHSSGATYECRREQPNCEKMQYVEYTYREYIFLHRSGLFNDRAVQRLLRCKTRKPNAYTPRVCKLAAVPKGIDKKRIVENENTTNQFYQHAIDEAIRDFVHKDYSYWHINLHSQVINRVACYRPEYGTLDLSSASDSVPLWMIRKVFPRNIVFCAELFRTKTAEVTIEGKRQLRPLHMWTPAGSAMCFIFETLLFTAICKVACQVVGVDDFFVVYGDDIITGPHIYNEVSLILSTLGFIINEDKSYPPYSSFKESCGIETFDQCDVSPLRLPRFYDSALQKVRIAPKKSKNGKKCKGRWAPPCLDSWIEVANRLMDEGCPLARAYMVRKILDMNKEIPFTQNYLHSYTDTNYHLTPYTRKDLTHGPDYQYCCLAYHDWVTTQTKGDDQLNYYNWLRTHPSSSSSRLQDDETSEVRSGAPVSNFKKRKLWLELP